MNNKIIYISHVDYKIHKSVMSYRNTSNVMLTKDALMTAFKKAVPNHDGIVKTTINYPYQSNFYHD